MEVVTLSLFWMKWSEVQMQNHASACAAILEKSCFNNSQIYRKQLPTFSREMMIDAVTTRDWSLAPTALIGALGNTICTTWGLLNPKKPNSFMSNDQKPWKNSMNSQFVWITVFMDVDKNALNIAVMEILSTVNEPHRSLGVRYYSLYTRLLRQKR